MFHQIKIYFQIIILKIKVFKYKYTETIIKEYCSKQKDELLAEDFQFLPNDVMQAMNRYTGLWSPVLADFALSFGTEYMYEEVPFILDQVFHTWTDLPEELSSQYSG